MIDVPIHNQVAERLRIEARSRGVAVQELLEKAVNQYLADSSPQSEQNDHQAADGEQARQQQWVYQQQALYESQHSTLYAEYAGQYIAMRDGEVLDHDTDRTALRKRVDQHFAEQPVFVTPVLPESRQVIKVHSTRLVR